MTLMAVVAMIHPGITALPIISGETVGIERVAGSVVLAVRGRIKLRAVPGILDDGPALSLDLPASLPTTLRQVPLRQGLQILS